MACDMPDSCKFPFLDRCQNRFLWTCMEVDHNVEKLFHALGFESLDPFLRVSQRGPCFTAIEEDGGDKSLVQLKLAR